MKLRIRENSLRLRLTQREVAAVAEGNSVTESTDFGDGQLTYGIQLTAGDRLFATFSDGDLIVYLPHSAAVDWASTDQVSLAGEYDVGEGRTLALLVEKDFACLSPDRNRVAADDADTFPHPGARAE